MRIRAMIAALAVACSLALCAVPAFADSENYTLVNGEYGSVTVTVNNSGFDLSPSSFAVGMYRTEQGIQLVCLIPEGLSASPAFWQHSENGTWVNTEIPATQTFLATATGNYRIKFTDGNAHYPIVQFNVTSLGEGVGNSTVGIFGLTTETIGHAIDWADTWISAILNEPVLLFFVLALALLTIGITVIKRLLAVRA